MGGHTTAYRIVSHREWQDTEDQVNALLKEGWELHGDLRVTDTAFSQPMVQREYHQGIDQSLFVTIEELDMIRYAIESVGEAIETLAKAVGYGAPATPIESAKTSPATKATKAKRKPLTKK